MKIFYALLAIIAIVGCGNNASVEFGMNDEALFDGVAGDLRMRVTQIEAAVAGEYTIVWEGTEYVQVELQTSDFASITNGYVDVEPGTYSRVRITLDSLVHVQQTATVSVVDSAFSFIAEAFTPIVISEGDELELVIVINAETWFNENTGAIIENHYPFEGAALRVFYGN
ncbi:MAG: hypothetical protein OEV79_08315 [candidate division WOR-3 bacterium]|nr:hypothetical protein [candidate division WOR-3 bacterium]